MLVNPTQADILRAAGIRSAAEVFALPEEIISGHTDRQVSRVRLGSVVAYLKKEHRVPWLERLRNWFAGFGWASKSWREARTLQEVGAVFPGVPTWIAAGELDDGRAFLLLREVPGVQLSGGPMTARQLGTTLAELHNCGFVHGDLFAPHVVAAKATRQIVFLDWQRAGRSTQGHWRDLAALDVTTDASPRDRLRCLIAYLRQRGQGWTLREAISEISRVASELRRRRHVRAKVQLDEATELLCLRGDELRVTRAFRRLWPHDIPAFLDDEAAANREVTLPDGQRGWLIRRRHALPRRQQFGAARRLWTSPERLQMNLLFRLQRAGIIAPEVLAAGEKPLSRSEVAAFLLVRGVPNAQVWLGSPDLPTRPAEVGAASRAAPGSGPARLAGPTDDAAEVGAASRAAPPARLGSPGLPAHDIGRLLARLHRVGCRCSSLRAFGVQLCGDTPRAVIVDPEAIRVDRRWGRLGDWWNLRLARRAVVDGAALEEGYRSEQEGHQR